MALADDITILRKGVMIDEVDAKTVSSRADLARRMVGRDVLLQVNREPLEPKQIVLRINRLSDQTLNNIDITVRQGEIFGIVGVAGNGQKRLVEITCGLQQPERARQPGQGGPGAGGRRLVSTGQVAQVEHHRADPAVHRWRNPLHHVLVARVHQGDALGQARRQQAGTGAGFTSSTSGHVLEGIAQYGATARHHTER